MSEIMNDQILKDALASGVFKHVMANQAMGYECTVCKTVMSGPEPSISHLNGKNHKKKLKLSSYFPGASVSGSIDQSATKSLKPENDLLNLVETGVLKKFEQHGALHFRCIVCAKDMSGEVPTQAHVVSAKHLKKLKQEDLSDSFRKSLSLASPLQPVSTPIRYSVATSSTDSHDLSMNLNDSASSETSNDDQNTLCPEVRQNLAQGTLIQTSYKGKKVFTCLPCSAVLTGEDEALAHLLDYSHDLNINMSSSPSTPSSSLPPQLDEDIKELISSGLIKYVSGSYNCLLCSVDSNSLICLRSHLNSKSHQNARNRHDERLTETDIIPSTPKKKVNAVNKVEADSTDDAIERDLIVLSPDDPIPSMEELKRRSERRC